jgi:hypothetical protein
MRIYLLTTLLCLSSFSFAQIKEQAEVDKIFAEWNKPDVPGGALGELSKMENWCMPMATASLT